jgi:hypothetical protein
MTNPYPPQREQACGNCFYRCDSECRRHAPRARINTLGETFWPNIDREDWCGEWGPAEAGQ